MEISKENWKGHPVYKAGERIFYYRGVRLMELIHGVDVFRCLIDDEEARDEIGVLSFLLVEETKTEAMMLKGKAK